MGHRLNGQFRGSNSRPMPRRIAVVVSRYNASITDKLLAGAVDACAEATGGTPTAIIEAPGSFELPCLAHAAASTGRYDGVVALGCVIRGETSHDQHIANAIANGITNASLLTGVPIAFGVLTVNTVQQARERAGGKHGNKGREAMRALLHTIDSLDQLEGLPAGNRAEVGAAAKQGGGKFPDKAATSTGKPSRRRGGR